MEMFIQVLITALITIAAILVVKKNTGEFALVLALLCICVLGVFVIKLFSPIVDVLKRLKELSGVSESIIEPVFKTTMVGILTNICSGICADCGENGIAKMVELCGTMMVLYLSIPLISAVLDLFSSLLGG